MIFQTYPNYGYSIIEAAIATIGLLLIVSIAINIIYENDDEMGKFFKRSSAITYLIIFGIIYAIRALFETFKLLSPLIRILNNDQLYLAIMITIYYPLHKPLANKFGFSIVSDDERRKYSYFNKFLIIFIVATWVVAGLFLTIPIFNIQMNNPDLFNLGILWTFAVVCIDVFITFVINRVLPNEQRVSKRIFRKSIFIASLFAFGIWCLQLFIFEVYLNRGLGFELIKQDIRVLIIVVSGLYIIFFFNSLKTKFLPEITEQGSKRVQEIIESKLEKDEVKVEILLEEQDSISNLFEEVEEESLRPPEGITFKVFVYFFKKLDKSLLSDEDVVSRDIFDNQFITNFVVILWGLMIGIFAVSIFLLTNSIGKILLLSCLCAFFMVVGDLLIIFLFNRVNPIHKRIGRKEYLNIIILGGIFTFWIWIIPFFAIFSLLFVWINDAMFIFVLNEVIYSIIMLFVGAKILRWYAGSVKMWNKSQRKANRVSFIWFIIDMPLRLFLIFDILLALTLLPSGWNRILSDVLITIINIIIGTFLIFKIYKRNFVDSIRLATAVQVILFLVTIGLKHLRFGTVEDGGILRFLETLILSYHFMLGDIRIPLVVATGIYITSYYFFSRITFSLDKSEEDQEKVRKIIESIEESEELDSMRIKDDIILDVKDLTTYFYTEEGVVKAVEGACFEIRQGEVVGLVGETGCGKSVTALSILRLVRPPGEIKKGEVIFEGEDLHKKPMDQFLEYRGKSITMIFQDPLNSLNPVFKIGDQISEVYRLHLEDELLLESVKKNTSIYDIARKRSQKMLRDLNIPTPRVIFDRYPHELSGGMRQRVQIAMALACSPRLLIADEPTTALDVTIQNQILKLMKELQKKYNTSILFITHDLGIISKMCDRVAVMYSGFIVEYGNIEKLFITPYHPYTRGLIAAVPVVGKKRELLDVIPGTVPNLIYPPSGCRFHPRCQYCFEPCDSKIPRNIQIEPDYYVACHLYDPQYKDLAEISIKKVESQN